MTKLILFVMLIVITVVAKKKPTKVTLEPPNSAAALRDDTPCCIDQLSTSVCRRILNTNPQRFLYNCGQSADFAFIQCCRTCFDNDDRSVGLDYHEIAEKLLINPATAECYNRHDDFCTRLMKRHGLTLTNANGLSCANTYLAFRICRATCGYCSTKKYRATAVYDYAIATNPGMCISRFKLRRGSRSNKESRKSHKRQH